MSLSTKIEGLLPGWMAQSPFTHWLKFAGAISLVFDAMIDGLFDGRLAAFPAGLLSNPDALPLIGRDRKVVRGFLEDNEAYAARLRQWRASWRQAGTAIGLLSEIRSVLQPNAPTIRVVSGHGTDGFLGVWDTIEVDGTYKHQTSNGDGFQISTTGVVSADNSIAHPWDWDSADVFLPDPYRIWVIIYAPTNAPLDGDEGVWGDGATFYGEEDMTVGTTATSRYVEMIRGVLRDRKCANVDLSHIIIAFDPTSFDPLIPGPYPAAGMPDGHWLNHGKIVHSGTEWNYVPARNQTARYGRGVAGTAGT